jgi:ComF family protein
LKLKTETKMLNLKFTADLLFPAYCAGCNNLLAHGEKGLCLRCTASLPKLHQYDYSDNRVERKFWGRADVEMATAFLRMTKHSIVRKLIHELKYHNNRDVGVTIGRLFGVELSRAWKDNSFDFILPVPLHPKRLFERGYNQCDCLAQGLSESMEVPVSNHLLVRTKYNQSQTRQDRVMRWHNVDGIFDLDNATDLQNKRVLLVDDVITTGATIEACAAVLNRIQGLKLSIAAIALAEN